MTTPTTPPAPKKPHRQRAPPPDMAQRMFEGQTITRIAKDYATNRNIAQRWAKDPRVVVELSTLRESAMSAARQKLESATGIAVDSLIRVLVAGKCPTCHRPAADGRTVVAAVSQVLDRGFLPKRTITEHAGEIGTPAPTREEATAILTEAAHIAEEEGERELAALLSAYIARRGKAPAGASSGYTSTTIPSAP